MSRSTGKSYGVSYFRRLVIDLMHFSSAVPSVTIDRRLDLSRVLAARQQCVPRPPWSAIFTKAYAMVAARTPELRTSYMKFPWPRFYEHPNNIATLNIDRQLPGERVVLLAPIRGPENRTLLELDAIIRYYKEEPVENIKSYCRAVRMSRVPWPLRRLVWWGALNMFGRRRCHNFGTFGITSLGSLGVGVHKVLPLLTSTLHYGMFDAGGGVEMRLSLDHRVLDGVCAARTLTAMEQTLNKEIVAELTALSSTAAA